MHDFRNDSLTAQNWLAEQAACLNEPDGDQGEIQAPEHTLDAETIRAMMHLLIPPMPATGKLSPGMVKIATRRFFVLAAVLCPEVGAGGFAAIAAALTKAGLSTSRAAISNIYVQLAEVTNSTTLGKSASARKAYSARAKSVWAMRTRKRRETAQKGADKQDQAPPQVIFYRESSSG